MQARIENPAWSVSGALEVFQKLGALATHAGIPATTLHLMHLRASQINGCSVCVDIHSRQLERVRESSERIAARHYPEPQLAALVVAIASINAFNRINVPTRQITGEWIARAAQSFAQAA